MCHTKNRSVIICSLVSVCISCWLISSWAWACNSCCNRLVTHNLHLHLLDKLEWKQRVEHVFLDNSGLNCLLPLSWVEQAQCHHIVVSCHITVCHVSSSMRCRAVERSVWWQHAAPEAFGYLCLRLIQVCLRSEWCKLCFKSS